MGMSDYASISGLGSFGGGLGCLNNLSLSGINNLTDMHGLGSQGLGSQVRQEATVLGHQ